MAKARGKAGDPARQIAELRRQLADRDAQLAERAAALNEALEQQTATR